MRGIITGYSACIIAEFVALLLSLYLGWELKVLAIVLAVIIVGFSAAIVSLALWANKGRI